MFMENLSEEVLNEIHIRAYTINVRPSPEADFDGTECARVHFACVFVRVRVLRCSCPNNPYPPL